MNKVGIFITLIILLLIISLLMNWSLYQKYQTKETLHVTNEVKYEIQILERTKDIHYMYGVATAYTPLAGGINSNGDPHFTSTMSPAKAGVIAVNPEVIPYGSEVMIICGNTVIRGQALDTGGAMRRNSNQVDILMEDYQAAIEWGRRNVHILWW